MTKSSGNNSVGKISLDLEVTSDLSKQISKVSKAIGKNLKDTMNNATKGMFDNMTNSLNKSMQLMNNSLTNSLGKMKENMKNTLINGLATLKNIKMPKIEFPEPKNDKPNTSNFTSKSTIRGPPIDTTVIKSEIENTAKALDIVNAKIEQQQAKLEELKQSYNMAFNEAKKNALQEKILKTESAINSLIAKSDKLGFKLSDLDAKLADAGNGAGRTASKFNLLSKITKGFGSLANGTANMTKKLSSAFKGLGSSCKESNKHMNNMHSRIGNIAKQFATWMIILPIIMNGLSAMASGLMANLKTNEQFSNSLAQIKTNLMVAFTPIYQAILPVINALMSALATATTYIASFISAIFGKTYQQSYQATQQLIDAKEAMGAYGDSAKKAAKDALGLAGFDEINKLNKSDSGSDNSKVPTLTQPSLNTDEVDSKMKALADKFKDILSKIFDPMKEAWEKEGKNTLNAMKYALSSIWKLVKDIGNTFLNVWDNGTGVKVCTDILKLLQAIFNIIGDIAKAFKTAWDNGNLGEKVIQAIFNALDSVLNLLIDIGNTFRDVWNNGLGVEICTNILEILKNIFTIIGQIADSFDKAWQTNGETIVTGILGILNNILSTISTISTNWINAWNNNGAGDELLQSILNLLGSIVTTLNDVTSGIGESFGKATESLFPTFIEFCTSISGSLTNITDGFKTIWDNGGQILFDGIVQLGTQIANLIMNLSSSVFSDFSIVFKDVLAPAIGTVFDAIGNVIQKLSEFIEWINSNKRIIDGLTIAVETFMAAWTVGKVSEFISLSGGLSGALANIATKLSATTLAQGAYNIATGIGTALTTAWSGVCAIATGVTTALGVAFNFLCSPIGLVIVAITAVIATGVLLYKHWDVVKQKAQECWNFVKQQFQNFQNWLGGVFSTDWSRKFGGFGDVLNGFLKTAQDIWSGLQTTFSGIINFISGVFTGNWSKAWNGVKQIFKGVFDSLVGIAKGPINSVIGLINGLISAVNIAIKGLNKIKIDIPDWIPGIGGESFGCNIPTIGKIPALAKGGIIDSPTLAMVGEAGKEAVVPLENNKGGLRELANLLLAEMGAGKSNYNDGSNNSGDIIFMLDGSVIGKVALNQLRKMQKQGVIKVIPT